MTGSCEHSDEPSDSIICREFFDWLRNKGFVRKDSASWGIQEAVVYLVLQIHSILLYMDLFMTQ
jgi:hypothetical protein